MLPGRILLSFEEISSKLHTELQTFPSLFVVLPENKNKKLMDIFTILSTAYIF